MYKLSRLCYSWLDEIENQKHINEQFTVVSESG